MVLLCCVSPVVILFDSYSTHMSVCMSSLPNQSFTIGNLSVSLLSKSLYQNLRDCFYYFSYVSHAFATLLTCNLLPFSDVYFLHDVMLFAFYEITHMADTDCQFTAYNTNLNTQCIRYIRYI